MTPRFDVLLYAVVDDRQDKLGKGEDFVGDSETFNSASSVELVDEEK